MSVHTGGPAFPRQTWDYYPSLNKTHAGTDEPGMTLRDYFAGQALVGFAANPRNMLPEDGDAMKIVYAAYLLADAMLAAREPTP